MSNMSYCRFRNTLGDLRDCYQSLLEDGYEDEDDESPRTADRLSSEEEYAKKALIKLCIKIAEEYGEEG